MGKKKKIPVSELPVMKACCKTCPFREDETGRQRDPKLAATVTQRTLFNAQQICHGTEGPNREWTHRCKGSYDFNKTLYERMGLGHLLK
jgi:hypothetical protein